MSLSRRMGLADRTGGSLMRRHPCVQAVMNLRMQGETDCRPWEEAQRRAEVAVSSGSLSPRGVEVLLKCFSNSPLPKERLTIFKAATPLALEYVKTRKISGSALWSVLTSFRKSGVRDQHFLEEVEREWRRYLPAASSREYSTAACSLARVGVLSFDLLEASLDRAAEEADGLALECVGMLVWALELATNRAAVAAAAAGRERSKLNRVSLQRDGRVRLLVHRATEILSREKGKGGEGMETGVATDTVTLVAMSCMRFGVSTPELIRGVGDFIRTKKAGEIEPRETAFLLNALARSGFRDRQVFKALGTHLMAVTHKTPAGSPGTLPTSSSSPSPSSFEESESEGEEEDETAVRVWPWGEDEYGTGGRGGEGKLALEVLVPNEFCMVLHAFAKSQSFITPQLSSLLLKRTLELATVMELQDASQMLWSVVRLDLCVSNSAPVFEALLDRVGVAAREAERREAAGGVKEGFGHDDEKWKLDEVVMGMTAYAMRKMDARREGQREVLGAVGRPFVERLLPTARLDSVLQLCWTLSELDYFDELDRLLTENRGEGERREERVMARLMWRLKEFDKNLAAQQMLSLQCMVRSFRYKHGKVFEKLPRDLKKFAFRVLNVQEVWEGIQRSDQRERTRHAVTGAAPIRYTDGSPMSRSQAAVSPSPDVGEAARHVQNSSDVPGSFQHVGREDGRIPQTDPAHVPPPVSTSPLRGRTQANGALSAPPRPPPSQSPPGSPSDCAPAFTPLRDVGAVQPESGDAKSEDIERGQSAPREPVRQEGDIAEELSRKLRQKQSGSLPTPPSSFPSRAARVSA